MSRLAEGEFFGTVVHSFRAPGVTLTETRHEPHQRVKTHDHEKPYLCYVMHGGFLERSRQEERVFESGFLIAHPARETHSDVFGEDGAVCLNLELQPDLFDFEIDTIDDRADYRRGVPKSIVKSLLVEMRRPDGYSLSAVRELTRDLVSWVHDRSSSVKAKVLRDVADVLIKDSTATDLDQIAKSLGICPVTLARRFRQQFGCSPSQFARRKRIERAVDLLSKDLSLGEVASACGFYDQSHFTNAFKHEVGMTPQRYRTRLNN